MSDKAWYSAIGAIVAFILCTVVYIVYGVGYTDGRQSTPTACEAKCDEIWRNGKLLKVVCPDSTGRMDYGQRR